MTEKIKNYLGIAIIIAILVVAGSAWKYVRYFGQSIEPSSFRSFAVTGEGKVVAIPDVAQFSFSVITEGGKDITKLQKENTDKVNRAISFVKSNGVEAKDIKTSGYNLSPRYQNYSCPREGGVCPAPEIVGYTITQTVEVKVRDFGKVGEILGGVVENGANSVSQLNFTIDDPTTVQNDAREEAIVKAKNKARSIAKAGGFSLGRLLSIDEGYSPVPYYRSDVGYGALLEKAVTPTIEPGSEDVTVNVTLRYEIR